MKWTNALTMLCAVAGVLPAGALSGARAARQPNIIYINADDLGWTDLACQGSTFYESPNIDRLAREGITFSNAYAPSANCAPSRACCMTGQYGPRHGIYTVDSSERGEAKDRKLIPTPNTTDLPAESVTIAEVFNAAGYVTGHVGKWHLGDDPLTHGYDVNVGGGHWGFPPENGYHSPYSLTNCEQTEEGEYLTDRLGREAAGFIRANKDRPFFLSYAPYSIHSPIQGKKETVEKYEVKTPSTEHDYPEYAAMVQSLDENVGRVLDTLKELDLERDTLVVFTSDNGGVWRWSKQWPLRAGKGSFTEGGIRVPMFMRWPGEIESGTVCETPVSGIDLFPTFLEAARIGAPKDKMLDGVSLTPLFKPKGSIANRALFWHFPIYLQGACPERNDPLFRTRPGSVVRSGDWKLHEYFEDGRLELYNLKDDIGEKNNLAQRKPEKRKELHELLTNWREDVGAPVPTEMNPLFESPEQARFQALEKEEWREVFSDECTTDWEEQWFLDGEIGTVESTPAGMKLTGGSRFSEDAHHMVLWTKESFEGDLKIEYDYTRLDDETRAVTILYIQAAGSGEEPKNLDLKHINVLKSSVERLLKGTS
jgi:arylsulfatase A-like enzyme